MITKEWLSGIYCTTSGCPGHLRWGRGRPQQGGSEDRSTARLALSKHFAHPLAKVTVPGEALESSMPSAFASFSSPSLPLTFRCPLSPFWSKIAKKGPRRSSTSQSSVQRITGSTKMAPTSSPGPWQAERFPLRDHKGETAFSARVDIRKAGTQPCAPNQCLKERKTIRRHRHGKAANIPQKSWLPERLLPPCSSPFPDYTLE